jgi:hypothetical protein
MRRQPLGLLLIALVLSPAPIKAAELRLSIDFAGEIEKEPEVSAEIFLRKSSGDSEAETIRAVLPLIQGAEKTFELEPATWHAELKASGYWSKLLEIDLDDFPEAAAFVLWPTAMVKGTLAFSKETASAAPEKIALSFSPPPSPDTRKGPRGNVPCPILDDSSFACEVPAGEFDVKLSAMGFSSAYRWNVQLQRKRVSDLGLVEFGPATGIIGWVALEEGHGRLDGVEIEVKARRSRSPPRKDTEHSGRELVHKTTTNERGFFQLQGLAPGAYIIQAKKEPFAPATASVRVKPDRLTEVVEPPLLLREPRSLQIFVQPPIPPDVIGGLWVARLIQLDQGNTPLRRLDPVDCSFSGWCEVNALSAGKYKLRIEDPDGKSWSTEELIVDSNAASQIIEIPIIVVRGTLSFGDEPLAASIFFGTKNGGIELVSNEEGQFEGFLPRPGDWRVEVQAKAPKLRRNFENVSVEENPLKGYAEVELVLPNTYLDGVVVDERDLPIPGAIVTVRGYDLLLDTFTQQGTDASGRFEFLGLPPGKFVLRAAKIRDSKRLFSQKIAVEIEEGIANDSLNLVMREELRLRGRVVAYGRGIPDAYVKAHSTTAMDLSVSKQTTDADGYFEIGVPPDSQEVLVGIGAPGFGYKMARSRLTSEQDVIISLEQAAGTLVIELEKDAAERPQSRILAVLHNGSMESADYLQSFWAPLNGIAQRAPDRYVLPWLEAGEYSVCATDPVQLDQLALVGSGGGACRGGFLPPGGELVLDLRRSD